jgi:hypothetical protein
MGEGNGDKRELGILGIFYFLTLIPDSLTCLTVHKK